jgi:hypothetical protein
MEREIERYMKMEIERGNGNQNWKIEIERGNRKEKLKWK